MLGSDKCNRKTDLFILFCNKYELQKSHTDSRIEYYPHAFPYSLSRLFTDTRLTFKRWKQRHDDNNFKLFPFSVDKNGGILQLPYMPIILGRNVLDESSMSPCFDRRECSKTSLESVDQFNGYRVSD